MPRSRQPSATSHQWAQPPDGGATPHRPWPHAVITHHSLCALRAFAVQSWRLAAGGWRLAAGGWRLAAGGWRLVQRWARCALPSLRTAPCPAALPLSPSPM
ncbi:hypothetical protein CKO17_08350 [Marichromatium gracile]|nr:hypothetical protein [Marichromatium gracile]